MFRKLGELIGIVEEPPRPQTPRYNLVEIDKSVLEPRGDTAAIISLKDHPGMIAILNRFRIQKAYLEKQLLNTRHKDLQDVHILQSYLLGLGFVESQIRSAIKDTAQKKVSTVVPEDEVNEQFEKISSAIEGLGITSL